MKTSNTPSRPFGLEFLTEVPTAQLARINGGRRHHKKHGPVYTTEHVSMPQPAFPTGDSG
jgi:hypothetical protein